MQARVAIVTGSGKGLGRAYALWLAARGYAVVVNNRVHPGLASSAQAVVDEIMAAGGRATAVEGAVDEAGTADALVSAALEAFGRLDILICNAGVMPHAPFAEMAAADVARTIDVNLMGTILPLQAAWRHMLTAGYGRVVLTGSTVGTYGHENASIYAATRSGVIGLARTLPLEVPEGADVRINVVLPFGYTNMSAREVDSVMGADFAAMIAPDRIAPAVAWLCSENCRHTGQIFHTSAHKITRVGIVESAPVTINPDNADALSCAAFSLEPLFEPTGSPQSVGALLRG